MITMTISVRVLKIKPRMPQPNGRPKALDDSKMGQDHYPATVLARDLNRDRTRGSAHFPHVRHRPKLPG
jgi:hypothetical protein